MERNLFLLSEKTYDLCIIGGGIYGACAAWEAILRGLSVVLVDKGDFGNATSSNSLKVIHGGLRYLQHGDIVRMRESVYERMIWMRIAPHLVHPLPFLIPTYRNSNKAKWLLYMAFLAYDLISFDRNRLEDPQKYIPRGRIISKRECLDLLPDLEAGDLTGAAIFYDGQMYNSERLLLSFVKSAAQAGAVVANYVEVTSFLKKGDRVTGIRARDVLTGDELEVRAKMVVNTTGPWVNKVLDRLNGRQPRPSFTLSKVLNIVVPQIFSKHAVGLQSSASRLFFITPWRNYSLIGTAHLPYDNGDPDRFQVDEEDVQSFIREINESRPRIFVRREDIFSWHGGLVPAQENRTRPGEVQLARHNQILDHRETEGIEGLLSVIGVKYTTGRSIAVKLVDRVFRKLGYKPAKSKSAVTPIYGGSIDRFDAFLAQTIAQRPYGLNEGAIRHLMLNHGAAYPEVLKYIDLDPDCAQRISQDSEVLHGELLYAIREEMAQKLADVVLRRTELGALGFPGEACLATCATIMSKELGWSQARTNRELEEVRASFSLGAEFAPANYL